MISLNEKDADRIAAYLRQELKEIDETIASLEQARKGFADLTDLLGEDSGKFNKETAASHDKCMARLETRKAEIGELLVLLMSGSAE